MNGLLMFCNIATVIYFFPLCQLYVAFSRIYSFDNITVAIIECHRHRIENDRLMTSKLYIEKCWKV